MTTTSKRFCIRNSKNAINGSRALLAASVLLTASAHATNYSESTSGDLSNDHLAPSFLALSAASAGNIISGTVGRANGVIDRDYLHFVVPAGYTLTQIIVGNGTTVGNNGSFIGIAAGLNVPIHGTAADATGLLGYHIYTADDVGHDVLETMSFAENGASGFIPPLGAGDYTLWVQETSIGNFNYNLTLQVSAVPEVAMWQMMLVGGALLGVAGRRRKV